LLKQLLNQADELNGLEAALGEEFGFDASISSHSARRQTAEDLNCHPLIQTTWVAFRLGWVVKCLHTIYDYLKFNGKNDKPCALVLAGYKAVDSNGEIGGGYPPLLQALAGHAQYDKAKEFGRRLFLEMEELNNFNEVTESLTAVVLLRLKNFVNVLKEHPGKKFVKQDTDDIDYDSHLFLRKVKSAALGADIDNLEVTLEEWHDLMERDFLTRNFSFAPWSDVRRVFGDEAFTTDVRSITNFMGHMKSTYATMTNAQIESYKKQQKLQEENRGLKVELSGVKVELGGVKAELGEVKVALAGVQSQMGFLVNALSSFLEISPPTPAASAVAASADTIASPASSPEGLQENGATAHTESSPEDKSKKMAESQLPSSLATLTVKDMFIKWHMYELYRASNATQAKGNTRSVFNSLKFMVEYFTLFLDEHVPEWPTGALLAKGSEGHQRRMKLSTMTDKAWAKFVQFYEEREPGKKQLDNVNPFKLWMKTRSDLPEGPNGETCYKIPGAGERQQMKTYAQLFQAFKPKSPDAQPKRKRQNTTTQRSTEPMTI
jgi:hypothetical protein